MTRSLDVRPSHPANVGDIAPCKCGAHRTHNVGTHVMRPQAAEVISSSGTRVAPAHPAHEDSMRTQNTRAPCAPCRTSERSPYLSSATTLYGASHHAACPPHTLLQCHVQQCVPLRVLLPPRPLNFTSTHCISYRNDVFFTLRNSV